jgi:hypothetical protein
VNKVVENIWEGRVATCEVKERRKKIFLVLNQLVDKHLVQTEVSMKFEKCQKKKLKF